MSQFVVSARKYRPTSFDEVVGQDHIAKTLKSALQTNQLAHAFLFTGPRGVGKTTCARILAKVINCKNPIDKVVACEECSSCTSFNDNASFNILELDAASNNSVEHMRALIEQVRFQPQEGKYKIFIIDEVHMLTSQAFNAFLKTLEEPPSYAIFILATTEKHKILPTILSRCQIFDFKRIQIADAVKQLEYICQKEGKTAEKEALHVIATKADGAMRDALSIFDKIASASSGQITYKDVIANLNMLDYEYYFKATDAFLREDIQTGLIVLDDVVRNGFDPEQFINGLADHFRELMIAKFPGTHKIIDLTVELKERYIRQAALCPPALIFTGLEILSQCELNLSRAKNKRLHVELAVSKLCFLKRLANTDILSETTLEKKNDNSELNHPKNTTNSNLESKSPFSSTGNLVQEPEPNPINGENKATIPIEVKKTISLSNIDSIRQKIMQEEAKIADSRRHLNIETIEKIWLDYTENNPSLSVQLALKYAILSHEEKVIKAYVPTSVSKDLILQEELLLERLRSEMGTPDLSLSIEVDRLRFPDHDEIKPTQNLTQKEKYLAMVNKNPKLQELVHKLGLKLEAETM